MDNGPAKVVWKLERIIERHYRFFSYLADFIGMGNYVDINGGNHDIDFYWEEVHHYFIQAMLEIYFGGERVEGQNEEEFAARIHFHQWFIYIPGRLYIAHGNQYDEYCSFENRAYPVAPFDENLIAMPPSYHAIRYFANQYKGFRTHDKDNWTLVDYYRWFRRQGMENSLKILGWYIQLAIRMLNYSIQCREVGNKRVREVHLRELETLAIMYGLSSERVSALDNLRHSPASESIKQTLVGTGIDRWFLVLTLLSLFMLILIVPVATSLQLYSMLGLFFFGGGLMLGWPKIQDAFLGGRADMVVPPKLRKAARKIAGLIDVSYIVLSHTHKPRMERIQNDPHVEYVNTGCFISPLKKESHDPFCRSSMTFALYRSSDNDLNLFRWCTRDNIPIPFDPLISSDVETPEELLEVKGKESSGTGLTRVPVSQKQGSRYGARKRRRSLRRHSSNR